MCSIVSCFFYSPRFHSILPTIATIFSKLNCRSPFFVAWALSSFSLLPLYFYFKRKAYSSRPSDWVSDEAVKVTLLVSDKTLRTKVKQTPTNCFGSFSLPADALLCVSVCVCVYGDLKRPLRSVPARFPFLVVRFHLLIPLPLLARKALFPSPMARFGGRCRDVAVLVTMVTTTTTTTATSTEAEPHI